METWKPLFTAMAVALAINAIPFVMAFVLRVKSWRQVGWFFYFLTLPFGLLCFVVGAIVSVL